MLTLAFETATVPGSVAIVAGTEVLASHSFERGERSAQWLAPTIKRLFAQVEPCIMETQLICCTNGPGSFTGLRIGVTSAKVLAYAIGCPVVALNTLDAIASQTPIEPAARLHVALGAQRKQLFARSYAGHHGQWQPATETAIVDLAEWIQKINARPSGQMVSGPAIDPLSAQFSPAVQQVPREFRTPAASSVARLGLLKFANGRRDDPWQLKPQYFRPSYAEDKG